MAVLYVTEFDYRRLASGHPVPEPVVPAVAEQTVAIGAGSVQSAAFNAKTKTVRIHTDAICSIAFGASPTATTSTARMAANQSEYFTVTAGQKVAVIANT